MRNQVKHVLRRLMRSPMFTAVTLAHHRHRGRRQQRYFQRHQWRPAEAAALSGCRKAGRRLAIRARHRHQGTQLSPSDYFTFRDENRSFQQFGIWNGDSVSITGLGAPEQVQSLDVTSGMLAALGVQPALGRWFTREGRQPRQPGDRDLDLRILAAQIRRRCFGDRPAHRGGRQAKEIIGVMPQSFRFLDEKPDLIFPFQFDRGKATLGNFSYQGIARLKPGVTLAQANADVARMIPIVNTKFPPPPGFSVKLFEDVKSSRRAPLKQDVIGDLGQSAVGADGQHRRGAADRVRQCSQPASGQRGRTPAGTRHPLVARRDLDGDRPGVSDGKCFPRRARRSRSDWASPMRALRFW